MELTSNGYPVVNSPAQLGRLTPGSPHTPIDELRAQLKAEGYLWLRGFFPREEVIGLRRRFFAAAVAAAQQAIGRQDGPQQLLLPVQ